MSTEKELQHQIKALEANIAEKQEQLESLKAMKEEDWPKVVKDYLHGDKESAWELCEDEFDIDDPDFVNNYRSWAYEVEFDIEVQKDGTAKIIKVNGRAVSDG